MNQRHRITIARSAALPPLRHLALSAFCIANALRRFSFQRRTTLLGLFCRYQTRCAPRAQYPRTASRSKHTRSGAGLRFLSEPTRSFLCTHGVTGGRTRYHEHSRLRRISQYISRRHVSPPRQLTFGDGKGGEDGCSGRFILHIVTL